MSKIGFLHTSPVHITTFDSLLAELAPHIEAVHQVAMPLLDLARDQGVDNPELQRLLMGQLVELRAAGVEQIVCTCSTLGDLAEKNAPHIGLEVRRVDRPMAAYAVSNGPNILMVATLDSTLALTAELIHDEAQRQGMPVVISSLFCEAAWSYFEADDSAGYVTEIAQTIRAYIATAETVPDVILLAQASMSGTAEQLTDLKQPVLSSPGSCINSLI